MNIDLDPFLPFCTSNTALPLLISTKTLIQGKGYNFYQFILVLALLFYLCRLSSRHEPLLRRSAAQFAAGIFAKATAVPSQSAASNSASHHFSNALSSSWRLRSQGSSPCPAGLEISSQARCCLDYQHSRGFH